MIRKLNGALTILLIPYLVQFFFAPLRSDPLPKKSLWLPAGRFEYRFLSTSVRVGMTTLDDKAIWDDGKVRYAA